MNVLKIVKNKNKTFRRFYMGFVVFFFLTWLFVSIFAAMPKKLTFVENTLVYLVILIVSINFSWIVIEELKLMSLTKKGFNYSAYLLERSIIIPIFILIQLNLLQWSKTFMKKLFVIISSVIVLVIFSFLSNSFHNIAYRNWNYAYDAIYYLFLNLIAIVSYHMFVRVSRNEVNYS
jgi:hypothetical protein